jgi:carbonic anhydrase
LDINANPSMTFDNETVYLDSWHIHTPAEHPIEGYRAKAELHLVHADAMGIKRAVVAIPVDASKTTSKFFSQFPTIPDFDDPTTTEMEVDMEVVLEEVDMLKEFWTYEGSLSSPPCHEGLRWFVSAKILKTSVSQMRKVLGSSMYSARPIQRIWKHHVNA